MFSVFFLLSSELDKEFLVYLYTYAEENKDKVAKSKILLIFIKIKGK